MDFFRYDQSTCTINILYMVSSYDDKSETFCSGVCQELLQNTSGHNT